MYRCFFLSNNTDFCNEKKKIIRKDNGTRSRQTFNQKRTGGEVEKKSIIVRSMRTCNKSTFSWAEHIGNKREGCTDRECMRRDFVRAISHLIRLLARRVARVD